ncbi:histidine phosphatase family protein [Halomonas alimentaria]|uniref:Histidine phosphatase family protein n=1 Tax=Halomonas alimentaria TaxID=147248 RepID=A0A7X5APG0_9GAMM|nr:histidine phosphatase family protein [Halomonas alimentaria]NAW35105.1 histidine phosphatase family protein [Halomonas alimentaria]
MTHLFPAASGRRHNRYLLIRHGHSQANQQGVIISSPEQGIAGYGLSCRGREQLDALLADWRWAIPQRILHSDFRRTTETAERIARHFGLPLVAETRLRERYFGDFEGRTDDHYAQVWTRDAADPTHRHAGVESVVEVAARMTAVIDELEERLAGETVMLVSHGDPLQILLAALEGRELNRHREPPSLTPASITVL